MISLLRTRPSTFTTTEDYAVHKGTMLIQYYSTVSNESTSGNVDDTSGPRHFPVLTIDPVTHASTLTSFATVNMYPALLVFTRPFLISKTSLRRMYKC